MTRCCILSETDRQIRRRCLGAAVFVLIIAAGCAEILYLLFGDPSARTAAALWMF